MAAADIGDACAAGRACRRRRRGRAAILHQVRVIAGCEEPLTADVYIGAVLVPADPVAGARGVDDAVGVDDRAVQDLEQPAHERGAGLVGQRDRVLRRQRVASGAGVVIDERPGRLGVEPFAGVVLVGAGALGEFGGGAGAVCRQVAVVAEAVAHHDERCIECGSGLLDRPEHERHQLFGIDRLLGIDGYGGLVQSGHRGSFSACADGRINRGTGRVRAESGDPPSPRTIASHAGRTRSGAAAAGPTGRRRAHRRERRAGPARRGRHRQDRPARRHRRARGRDARAADRGQRRRVRAELRRPTPPAAAGAGSARPHPGPAARRARRWR